MNVREIEDRMAGIMLGDYSLVPSFERVLREYEHMLSVLGNVNGTRENVALVLTALQASLSVTHTQGE